MMSISAYTFITTNHPRRTVRAIRKIRGVVRADVLSGMPDAIVVMEGDDMAAVDGIIERIYGVTDVIGTDSRVAHWVA
jgi:hypothetical protein